MTVDLAALRARHAHCPADCDMHQACDEIERLRALRAEAVRGRSRAVDRLERARRHRDRWKAIARQHWADPNRNRELGLLRAEIERLRTIVASLIEEPADTNTRSANGATPHTRSVECGAKNDPGERSQHSPGPAEPPRRAQHAEE